VAFGNTSRVSPPTSSVKLSGTSEGERPPDNDQLVAADSAQKVEGRFGTQPIEERRRVASVSQIGRDLGQLGGELLRVATVEQASDPVCGIVARLASVVAVGK